jgi:AGZA family xanthine/uracil permease-like MFS transporter
VIWAFIGDALPAFVTIVSMPFTYSVAYGLIAGLFTYTVLNGLIYITKLVSRGKIQPPDADLKEYWTYKPGGQLPWFIRTAQGKLWFRSQGEGVWAETAGEGNWRQGSGSGSAAGTEASEKELVDMAPVPIDSKVGR